MAGSNSSACNAAVLVNKSLLPQSVLDRSVLDKCVNA